MNSTSDFSIWLQLLAVLVLETAVIIGVAAALQRLTRSATWRRTLWQAGVGGLAILVLLEFTGLTRQAMAWTRATNRSSRGPLRFSANPGKSSPIQIASSAHAPPHPPRRHSLPLGGGEGWGEGAVLGSAVHGQVPSAQPRRSVAQIQPIAGNSTEVSPPQLDANIVKRTEVRAPMAGGMVGKDWELRAGGDAVRPLAAPASASAASAEAFADWFILLVGGIWLGGSVLITARFCGSRFGFWFCRRQRWPATEPPLLERVQALARRMGYRRPWRLVETKLFSCPVAFGWFRPSIGLPLKFVREYSPAQQEVMLAHELAHLTSRDPVWYAVADLLSATLWWHPLVWWARQQLQVSSEAAADEACLLVTDGPALLAECLVTIGEQLAESRPLSRVGIEGNSFRSGLGRRVARLVELRGRAWHPPQRWRLGLTKALAPVGLVAASVLCAAWTLPQTSTTGSNMKTRFWNHSLATMAVMAALNTDQSPARAADSIPAPVAAIPSRLVPTGPPPPVAVAQVESKEAQALRAKLEAITMDNVLYDGLPLGEVVKSLTDYAAKSGNKSLNFLFSRTRTAMGAGAIDPATGLPAPAEEVDLASVSIRINPPLKNVRMSDVLDAITKVADRPIKYTLEGYAVVFSVDAPERPSGPPLHYGVTTRFTPVRMGNVVPSEFAPGSPRLPAGQPPQTRAFKISKYSVLYGAERAFGVKIPPETTEEQARNGLFEVFQKAGAKVANIRCVSTANDVSLLIRAEPEDMEVIQATIEFLGGSSLDQNRLRPSAVPRGFPPAQPTVPAGPQP